MITIKGQISAHHMGDGWPDVNEATTLFARYLESRFELAARQWAGDEDIEVDIEVLLHEDSSRAITVDDGGLYQYDSVTAFEESPESIKQKAFAAFCAMEGDFADFYAAPAQSART